MIPVSLNQMASVLNARLQGADLTVDAVTTDTRKLTPGSLFVALKGEHFDGHDFAQQAQAGGAGALLVSHQLPCALPQLIVSDTRQALSEMAGWLRGNMSARVVALTGSSGKTSVKEMTAAILQQCGATLFTKGNLNNEIGVPLTLLRLTTQHEFAVIELGANHLGEIARSVQRVQPQAALVNNLSPAHLEGFGSITNVAQAKGEIFTGLQKAGIAIINDHSHDLSHWQTLLAGRKVWCFSPDNSGADFYARGIQRSANASIFTLHTPQGAVQIHLPLPGVHNLENALAAAALAMAAGASLNAIKTGLEQVQPVIGRLYPIRLAENQRLIDDSYNANVDSMCAAISVLAEQPGYRVLVVGDMAELGEQTQACHRKVGQAARDAGIDRVLSVGQLSALISDTSGAGEHFADKPALITRLCQLLRHEPVISILVKGSRSSAMEQVVKALREDAAC